MMYRVYAKGTIEIITGPMFSGKSEELIKRIKILGYAKVKTLVVKPALDNRWIEKKIISRAGNSIDTIVCKDAAEIMQQFQKAEYSAIAIDEVQFFDEGIIKAIEYWANHEVRVIISGLDMDYEGKPFAVMPTLLAMADMVDKEHAVCAACGKAATMSFRKVDNSGETVQIGDKEYEPRCRSCHYKGMADQAFQTQEFAATNKSKAKTPK